MTKTPRRARPHGGLRPALVQAGVDLLETDETFSLRAVARHVGVSEAAPYRHFADRDHLEAAMAARGFRTLQERLEQTIARHDQQVQLVDLALTYVHYAVENPALYRLMFARPCGAQDERVAASLEVFAVLEDALAAVAPGAPPHGLATAGWALAHGMASLHLDGKLVTSAEVTLDDRVHEVFDALAASGLPVAAAVDASPLTASPPHPEIQPEA